jgi:hypothetical protein
MSDVVGFGQFGMLMHNNGAKAIGFSAVYAPPCAQVGIGAIDILTIDCGHRHCTSSISKQLQLPVFSSEYFDKT